MNTRERDLRRLTLSVFGRAVVATCIALGSVGVVTMMGGQVHVGAAEARRLVPALWPVIVVGSIVLLGATWLASRLIVLRRMGWFAESRPANMVEVARFGTLPRTIAWLNLAAWTWLGAAALVYGTSVANFSLDAVALAKTSLVFLYGFLTSTALTYLLVERAFRPYLSLLLSSDGSRWPPMIGITGRLIFAWSTVAGAPLVLLALTWIGFTERQMVLGGPALRVWALVAAAVGAVVFVITGRSMTEPLDRLRHALRRVGEGDFSAQIQVDEAAEIGQVQAGFNEMVEQLRRQVAAIQESRTRIVEAADTERARIERNLHDGAQQRLLALSFALRSAQGRLQDPGLDHALRELEAAMAELRELARGIHPAILDEEGLGPALSSLAERAPVPTEVRSVLNGRLPSPVEVTAYFVVAESLANVARYADASTVKVEAVVSGDALRVEVADDGKGGADPQRGSGLRGLADRVAALGGELTIESPSGAGTKVHASIPVRDT